MDPNMPPAPQPADLPSQQNTPNKRKLIIFVAIAGVGILLLLIIIIFAVKPASINKTTTQLSPTPVSVRERHVVISPYELTKDFDPQTAPTQTTPDYKIKYPSDWTHYSFPTKGNQGGSLFEIFPNILGKNDGYYPRMDIFYYYSTDSASLALQKRVKTLITSDQTQQIDTTFHGYPAKKLWGPLHLHIIDTVPAQDRDLYKTYYAFVKGNYVFLVDYAYDGTVQNPKYEKYFQDILATLTFNP